VSAAVALACRLLADFATGLVAFGLGHGLEAVALADRLAFAGVFSGFAVVHAFAGSDAVAMNRSIGGLYLGGDAGKQGAAAIARAAPETACLIFIV